MFESSVIPSGSKTHDAVVERVAEFESSVIPSGSKTDAIKDEFGWEFERSVVEKTLPQAVRDGCRSFRAFSFLQSFYKTAVTDFTVRRYAYVVPKGKM